MRSLHHYRRSTLTSIFLLRNNDGETFLHVLLECGVTYERLLAIVDQCDESTYNKFLLFFTRKKESFLHLAAKKCKAEVFEKLLTKAFDDVLSLLAPERNYEKSCLLAVLLDYQSETVVELFVRRLTSKRLSIAMFNNMHLMWNIARHHSSRIIKALLSNISNWPMEDLVLHKHFGQNALDVFIKEQGWHEVLLLLSRLSDKNIIRAIEQGSRHYILRGLFNIVHDYEGWDQFSDLRDRLITIMARSCFSDDLVKFAIDRFINKGKSLYHNGHWLELLDSQEPAELDLKKITLSHCIAKKSGDPRYNMGVFLYNASKERRDVSLLSLSRFHSTEVQPIQSLLLGNGESLYFGSISEEVICQQVWEHGVASWLEYRSLLAQFKQSPLRSVLLLLYKLDAVLIGVRGPFPVELINATAIIYNTSRANNLLMKMIDPSNIDDFVKQLEGEYEYRPQLRLETPKEGATHKFYHMKGRVGLYPMQKSSTPTKKNATRKMAMTLISETLDTHLYREQHKDQLLVGVGLNRAFCTIKAMLFSDRGTYQRGWVGSLHSVSQYKNKIEHINFTDIDAFIEAIRKPDAGVNEVLAKITREALQCIVIGRDTLEARKVACVYQRSIRELLGVNLPIIFYDAHLQALIPYDPEFYAASELCIREKRENEKELSAKERLLAIRVTLTSHKKWHYKFFSHPVQYGHDELPERILTVITLIDSAFTHGFQSTLTKVLKELKKFDSLLTRESGDTKNLMADLLYEHRRVLAIN